MVPKAAQSRCGGTTFQAEEVSSAMSRRQESSSVSSEPQKEGLRGWRVFGVEQSGGKTRLERRAGASSG